MSAAKPKSVGLKRICTSCGVRFYDLNKRPIACPSCATEFTGDAKVKTRRGRLPVDAKKEDPIEETKAIAREDILEDVEGIEVVSLEDAEVDGDDDADDTDIDLDAADLDDTLPEFEDDLAEDDKEEDVLLEEEVED